MTGAFATDSGVRVVRAPMADGRELIYFDDAGSTRPPTRRPDLRDLPQRPPTATMRRDVLTGDWVSVATARQTRVMLPPKELDPLAPQSEGNPSEIPDDYDVVVFENRSPSFGPTLLDHPADDGQASGAQEQLSASGGRCEVVCFSPASEGSLGQLPTSRVRTVIEAWAHRTEELSALPGIAQVFPFENRGQEIGVTLHHPHGQIYAYPYVTPRTRTMLAQVGGRGKEVFDQIVERESTSQRLLARTEHWVAFVPFAARWPLELHVLPLRHLPSLAHTTRAERDELAELMPRLLRAVDGVYDTPSPYMAGWHQAPVGTDDLRLMLTITSPRRAQDKLKFLAGSEAIMGAWVADVRPEDAADLLRAAMVADK